MPKSTETMELIAFQVPKPLKKLIEKYAKENGFSISYVVRKSVETQILDPNMKTQAELWKIMLAWTKDVEKWTKEVDEWRKSRDKKLEKLEERTNKNFELIEKTLDLSKGNHEIIGNLLDSVQDRPTRKQLEDLLIRVLTRIEKERHKS